jgi:hypothetical protein
MCFVGAKLPKVFYERFKMPCALPLGLNFYKKITMSSAFFYCFSVILRNMPKYSFLFPLLFSLTLCGFGLELASPYLDGGYRFVFAYGDVEQEQEDNNGQTKPAKNDEDRQRSVFLSLVIPSETETHRRQAPGYAERALPATFLSIFSPPPEQCIACDIA